MMFGELVAERCLGNINIELYRGDAYFVRVSLKTAPLCHLLISQQMLGDEEADALREELERGALEIN